MNWCKPHWDALRAAIEAKGLSKFVARSSGEAIDKMTDDDKSDTEAFEPLMGCWARINMAMLESPALRGRALACPLCILVADGQPDKVNNWLDGVTTEALNHAIHIGLVQSQ